MKPDPKVKKDKSILAYVHEMNDLYKVRREAPLIKLAESYQNGWTKYFVLRDDYTRRADAHVFKKILETISTEVFCRKQNFLDRKGVEYGPGLRIIGVNEWEMLGWPQQYKKHFTFGLHMYKNVWGTTGFIRGYKISRHFFFEEAIRPHFVTHMRTVYPDVESRLTYLRNKFDKEQLWVRFHKIKGARRLSRDWVCAKQRYLETIGTKEMEEYDKS